MPREGADLQSEFFEALRKLDDPLLRDIHAAIKEATFSAIRTGDDALAERLMSQTISVVGDMRSL